MAATPRSDAQHFVEQTTTLQVATSRLRALRMRHALLTVKFAVAEHAAIASKHGNALLQLVDIDTALRTIEAEQALLVGEITSLLTGDVS